MSRGYWLDKITCCYFVIYISLPHDIFLHYIWIIYSLCHYILVAVVFNLKLKIKISSLTYQYILPIFWYLIHFIFIVSLLSSTMYHDIMTMLKSLHAYETMYSKYYWSKEDVTLKKWMYQVNGIPVMAP